MSETRVRVFSCVACRDGFWCGIQTFRVCELSITSLRSRGSITGMGHHC